MTRQLTINSVTSLPSSLFDSFSNFDILLWNVRSIHLCFSDISLLLHSNQCYFALLSENWLLSGFQFSLPHFQIIRSRRINGYRSAVMASYYSIQIIIIIDLALINSLEFLSISLIGINNFIDCKIPLKLWFQYIYFSYY